MSYMDRPKSTALPETIFTPEQLTALDAWIDEQNGYADDLNNRCGRDSFYYAVVDGYACFQAYDQQLDLHIFDVDAGEFMSVCDYDDHPLYDIDLAPPEGTNQ